MGSSHSNLSNGEGGDKTTRMKCYYEIVGVSQEATSDEIKKAYRKKALLCHPDKNSHRPEEAHEEFQLLQSAYDVLSDEGERRWYDRNRLSLLKVKTTPSSQTHNQHPDDLLPFFERSSFASFNDEDPKSFYAIYGEVFSILEEGKKKWYFGSSKSNYYPEIRDFYDHFSNFTTTKTFQDFFSSSYDATNSNRRGRRHVEKEMDRDRQQMRLLYIERVRELASWCRRRDPRYQTYLKELSTPKANSNSNPPPIKEKIKKPTSSFVEPKWSKISQDQLERAESEFYSSRIEDELLDELEEELIVCNPCNKTFKQHSQWKNHEKSKKHRQALWSLGISTLSIHDYDPLDEVDDPLDVVDDSLDVVDGPTDVVGGPLDHDSDVDVDVVDDATDTTENINDKKSKKKLKEKKKKEPKESKVSSTPTYVNRCSTCPLSFPSRNKLFQHLKEMDHLTAITITSDKGKKVKR